MMNLAIKEYELSEFFQNKNWTLIMIHKHLQTQTFTKG